MTETPAQKNRVTLFTFVGLLAFFLIVTARMVTPYLLAVFMGSVLSIVARPVYSRLSRGKLGSKTTGLITTIGILLLLVGPIAGFVAMAVDQAIELATYLTKLEGFSLPYISERLSQFKPIRTIIGDAAAIDTGLKNAIQSIGKFVSTSILAIVGSLPALILQLVLALFACFYFLVDGRRLLVWLQDKIPLDSDVRTTLFQSFQDTAQSAIMASLSAGAVQSTIMFTAYLLLGIPAAFLAVGATFILAWVPLIGSTPVWLGGAIYLLVKGSTGKMILMLLAGVLTGLSDNIVYPLVLKGKGNIHPLVGLVAIFGGIEFFGIMGVFVGPILAAILITLLNIWPEIRQRFGVGDPTPAETMK